jgi:hypothetical protein
MRIMTKHRSSLGYGEAGECRIPKERQNGKRRIQWRPRTVHSRPANDLDSAFPRSGFVIDSSFFIRISSF